LESSNRKFCVYASFYIITIDNGMKMERGSPIICFRQLEIQYKVQECFRFLKEIGRYHATFMSCKIISSLYLNSVTFELPGCYTTGIFKSSVMWHSVIGPVVLNVSKDHSHFILWVQVKQTSYNSRPWRWGLYDSTHWTQCYTQSTWVISNNTM